MDKTAKLLTELIKYEICGITPENTEFSDEDLRRLFILSKKHDLTHMAGDALIKLNRCEGDIKKRFQNEIVTAVYRCEKLESALEDVKNSLDVPFIPLKGAVMRLRYPEKWMRTSCDIDILVKKCDHERAVETVKKKLNCIQTYETEHDVSLLTPNGTHIEIHHILIKNDTVSNYDRVLDKVWDYAREKNGFEYEIEDAMFYCYHIAHMAKHFKNAGCGMRPFIDLYILRHCMEHNEDGRKELVRRAGLEEFSKTVEKLSDIWFIGGEYDDLALRAEEYLLCGGVYGNSSNLIKVRQVQMGKAGYIISRLWLPYGELKKYYTSLEGKRLLLPLYEIRRWFRIVVKERGKGGVLDLTVGRGTSKSELACIENMFDELKIK